jgi:hypothetical protein
MLLDTCSHLLDMLLQQVTREAGPPPHPSLPLLKRGGVRGSGSGVPLGPLPVHDLQRDLVDRRLTALFKPGK